MTADNGNGVWGFIILIGCLLLFGVAFIKFVMWLVAIGFGLLIIGNILDWFRFFSLGMPKDEDE